MDQKDRSVIRAHATVDQSATNFAGDAPASIKKTQQSLLRSECFITAMKRSAPMMNNSIDGAQPSVNSIQMTTARPGGRNSRLADRTADMRLERLLYFALLPSERVRGKPGGRRPCICLLYTSRCV